MKDLTSPVWIKVKGALFLLVGLLAATLLVLENATWKATLLLALAIWCFCRFYYFAFYVIERYVDSDFRFAGLCAFASYLVRRRNRGSPPPGDAG